MAKLNDRIARLERASDGSEGIEAIEWLIVEPSPTGPLYTGDVCRVAVGSSEQVWRHDEALAGKPAERASR